ncbi:autotransporter domain-containing protein [Bosea sp. F3-2]|uniref:autotransporter outer membrane beta-barrel domain-containing protein n=1 Tax=Bosea sp. F3-2 TaxID=2599640 RepID=UPI0011EF1362|nr:autotransporter domain-containing protein [Bosea sp. F3-2]QEL24778.1 autotransporter domain-containing protein [Bosea sp. F3-2]
MRQSTPILVEPGLNGSMQTLRPKAPSSHPVLLVAAATAVMVLLMGVAQAQSPNTVVEGVPVTVPGTQSSPWSISNNLMVGNTLGGTLIIESGGQVNGTTARVGSDNVTGTVTVRDANSVWANTGAISIGVGSSGFGFLNILNGGSVSNTTAEVGVNAGGTGTVTVSGSGSQWANSQTLAVGWYGNGTVTIDNGGAVSAPVIWMGVVPGAQGTLTLSGTAGNRGVLTTGLLAKGLGNGQTGDATLNLDGGILRASADRASFLAAQADYRFGFAAGDVVIGTGGAFIDSNGHAIGISAALGGSGGLTKLGAGTLTLSGANTYAGGTTISDGVLVANTTSLRGPVLNNAVLVFNQPVDGTFSGNISGSGSLKKDGAGALTLAGINTYTGGTQVNGGTLVIAAPDALGSGPVAFGGGVLRFDYTGSLDRPITVSPGGFTVDTNGNTQTMSAPLAGSDPFTKVGSGSLNLTGNSPLTGPTSVQAGRLAVNGSLANSTITVQNGATLGGNGTIGGLVVQNGGFAAPGNSIGTLTVAGNVAFGAGSVYQVEINAAGQSDRIVASGMATISGGTVQVLAENGNYAAATNYTILTAGAGVTGRFANVTSNLAFLTPSLSNDSSNVTLTMTRNQTGFAGVALTRNQGFTANATERLGVGQPVYDALLSTTATEARAGFDLLSGEAHAQAVSVAIGESALVREAILGHLRGPLLTPPGASIAAAFSADLPGSKSATVMPAPRREARYALWGEALGGQANTNADGNAAGLSRRTGGAILGADMLLFNSGPGSLRVGVAGGYTQSRFDLDARLSSGRLESGHAALYAGSRFGAFRLDAGLSLSWSESDIRRQVAIRGFGDLLRSQRPGSTAQAFAELGYGFTWQGLALEPFAQLALIRVSTEAGLEQGGAAALRLVSSEQNPGFTTLGLRAEAQILETPLFARGMVGWRHGFGDLTPQALTAFATGIAPARVFAAPIDRDGFAAEAGLDWRATQTTTLGLTYAASLGERTRDHALKGRIDMRF